MTMVSADGELSLEDAPGPREESAPPNASPSLSNALAGITTVIVAIHGIGSQRRSDTIRSVAERFAGSLEPSLPSLPLGYFRLDDSAEVHISRLPSVARRPEREQHEEPAHPSALSLQQLGFAEVYWADIPKRVVDAKDTLEETKRWAKSVVSRAHAMYEQVDDRWLDDSEFRLGAGIIEEIIETIAVLENLLFVADKAGVFKFELGQILRDYLGDVQLVSEFSSYRAQIVGRFHLAMQQIIDAIPSDPADPRRPDIYIVAHSEGTVVSFLAMLQALASPHVVIPGVEPSKRTTLSTSWIKHVRGFMTLGSPIDKHLALWDALWKDVRGKLATDVTTKRDRKIRWRNYYDFGDPIGFKLDGARDFLRDERCAAFEFEDAHDIGYSRSWVPGKAHNDYWNDAQVFEHFLHNVILEASPDPERDENIKSEHPIPKTSHFKGVVSMAIPYAVSALLHFVAVFVLFKSISAFAGGTSSRTEATSVTTVLATLLVGVTVAARLPRLVSTRAYNLYWPLLAMLAFGCGAAAYVYGMHPGFKHDVLSGLTWMLAKGAPSWQAEGLPVLLAALVAVSGWIVPRHPRWARRALLGAGIGLIAVVAVSRLRSVGSSEPVWPVVLGGLGFLYLWWLAILLFDLAFVWHRYIRFSVGVDTLRAWKRKTNPPPGIVRRAISRRRGSSTREAVGLGNKKEMPM